MAVDLFDMISREDSHVKERSIRTAGAFKTPPEVFACEPNGVRS
eukprot:COSAG06_NODE_47769_length_337_cov_0.609244_1_plen_43_part_01